MAGRGPTVTLTFAGDANRLERTLDRLSGKTNHFSEGVRKASMVSAIGFAGVGAAAAAGALTAAGALAAVPLAFGAIGIAAIKSNKVVEKRFDELGDKLKAKVATWAKPLEGTMMTIANNASAAIDRIGPAMGAIFASAGPALEKLSTALMKLVEGALPGIQTAMGAAKPVIDALATGLTNMGPAISGFFTNLSSGSQGAAGAMGAFFTVLNGLLPVLGSVLGFLAQWASVIVPIAAGLAALAAVVWLVNAGLAVYNAVTTVVKAATTAWTAVQWLLNAALTANPIGIVIMAIAALVAGIIYAWNNCESFRAVVLAVWEAIKTAFSAGVDWVKSALAWFGTLPGLFMGWFNSAKDAVVNAFNGMLSFIGSIPGKILGLLGNLGSLLVGAGQALVNGLLSGIQSAWQSVVNFVASGVQSIRNLLPFSPAKEGPFSGRGYVTYSGKALTTDFANSLRDGMPNVAAAAKAVMDTAHGTLTGSVSVGAPRSAMAGAGSAVSASVTFNGNMSDALATVVMQMIRTGKIQVAA